MADLSRKERGLANERGEEERERKKEGDVLGREDR